MMAVDLHQHPYDDPIGADAGVKKPQPPRATPRSTRPSAPLPGRTRSRSRQRSKLKLALELMQGVTLNPRPARAPAGPQESAGA